MRQRVERCLSWKVRSQVGLSHGYDTRLADGLRLKRRPEWSPLCCGPVPCLTGEIDLRSGQLRGGSGCDEKLNELLETGVDGESGGDEILADEHSVIEADDTAWLVEESHGIARVPDEAGWSSRPLRRPGDVIRQANMTDQVRQAQTVDL